MSQNEESIKIKRKSTPNDKKPRSRNLKNGRGAKISKPYKANFESDSPIDEVPVIDTKKNHVDDFNLTLTSTSEEEEKTSKPKKTNWKPTETVELKPKETVELKPKEPVEPKPIEPIEPKPIEPVGPKPIEPVESKHNLKPISYNIDEMDSYTVFRQKQIFGGTEFRMMKDDKPIFFTSKSQDGLSKFYIISTTKQVTLDSPGFVGFLRIHQSSTRFTLVSNDNLPNDDRDPEIMGLSFIKSLNPDIQARQFKLVLPKNNQPFYPISKRLNLSRVAQSSENLNEFNIYISELPKKSEKGTLQLSFSGAFVQPSVKNFIIKDKESNETIFMVFKVSNETFRIKFFPPFTPLIGFGIAISVIIGNG